MAVLMKINRIILRNIEQPEVTIFIPIFSHKIFKFNSNPYYNHDKKSNRYWRYFF